MAKNPTPYDAFMEFFPRADIAKVAHYLKRAKLSKLTADEKGKRSLKNLSYAIRDHAKASEYDALMFDLFALAVRHADELANLTQALNAHGSPRLKRFVKKVEKIPKAHFLSFKTPHGSYAFNNSTQNLASEALKHNDIYFATSEDGSCIMTRRNWTFDQSFKPTGYKRVYDNLFVSDDQQVFRIDVLEDALKAIIR